MKGGSMVRRVLDDFEAFEMCNAMRSVGVMPFSVVFRPSAYIGDTAAWFVFGNLPEQADHVETCNAVDKAFEKDGT